MKVRCQSLVRNRHRLGAALLVSAFAHLALLALLLPRAARPEADVALAGQRRGALTVRSMVAAAPQPQPTSRKRAESPVSPSLVKPRRPTVPQAEPAPAAQPALPAAPEPAPAPPGARFASLFAPILNQPLGRGRWGAAPSPPPPAPPPDAGQLRQQALIGLIQAIRQRLDGTGPAACHLRLNMDSREAVVDCANEADSAQTWAILQGLLHPGDPGAVHEATVCLQIGQEGTLVQTCPNPSSDRTAP